MNFADTAIVAVISVALTAMAGWMVSQGRDRRDRRREERAERAQLSRDAMDVAYRLYRVIVDYERDGTYQDQLSGLSLEQVVEEYRRLRPSASMVEGRVQRVAGREVADRCHEAIDVLTYRFVLLAGCEARQADVYRTLTTRTSPAPLTVDDLGGPWDPTVVAWDGEGWEWEKAFSDRVNEVFEKIAPARSAGRSAPGLPSGPVGDAGEVGGGEPKVPIGPDGQVRDGVDGTV